MRPKPRSAAAAPGRLTLGPSTRAGLALAAALALGSCARFGVVDPQGPVSLAEHTILIDSLVIMLAIVVPTLLAALLFAWWFRAGNSRAQYRPNFVYSGRIELIVWGIPLLVITFLGGIIWIGSHELDPAMPLPSGAAPVNVQAVSLDWKWLFIYPDLGVAAVNTLPIPAGRPIHLALTSGSVMTAFFVPQLGTLLYTMNGMVNQLNIQATHPGDYFGEAAHYSGDGFSGMHFTVHAMSDADFATWAAGVRAAGPTLDRAEYAHLAKQSQNVAPFTYKAIDQALFHDIATGIVPPGPGPVTGRGGTDVHPKPEG